jgi:hypothetical protein
MACSFAPIFLSFFSTNEAVYPWVSTVASTRPSLPLPFPLSSNLCVSQVAPLLVGPGKILRARQAINDGLLLSANFPVFLLHKGGCVSARVGFFFVATLGLSSLIKAVLLRARVQLRVCQLIKNSGASSRLWSLQLEDVTLGVFVEGLVGFLVAGADGVAGAGPVPPGDFLTTFFTIIFFTIFFCGVDGSAGGAVGADASICDP